MTEWSDYERTRLTRRRLIIIEEELGISGPQVASWENFMTGLQRATATVRDISDEISPRLRAPSALEALRQQRDRLKAESDATTLLHKATQELYRTLSSKQRQKADRLVTPIVKAAVLQPPT